MATRPTVMHKRQRREAKDCCDWTYWQEILTDDEGFLCDESGTRLKGTNPAPIMVWRQKGNPCDTCLEADFRRVTNRCAEGKCKSGMNCPKHRYRYTDPPCYGCGHYHKRGGHICGVGTKRKGECKCSEVIPWPESYPPPAAAQEQQDGERKAIEAYHRGSQGQVRLRQKRQAERQQRQPTEQEAMAALVTDSPESRQFWGSLVERVRVLSKPDNLNAMARRILSEQQAEGKRACSYGEGLYGTVALDVDTKGKLEALIAEQRADDRRATAIEDETDPENYDALGDDEEDDYSTGQRRVGRLAEDEDADAFDLDYLLQ